MNKPHTGAKPHVHAEVIKAWADGAEIEYFSNSYDKWIAVVNNNPCWSSNEKYRVKPKVTHKVGNVYRFCDGNNYMLACTSVSHIVMIAISGSLRGCRAVDAVKVEDIWKITEKEFEVIVGGTPSDYTLIEPND